MNKLWSISRDRPKPARQCQLDRLLEKNQRSELTDRERGALVEPRAEGDRRMLQRSYAALLLKYRGRRVLNLENF